MEYACTTYAMSGVDVKFSQMHVVQPFVKAYI
jgi:hypothetical protein